MNLNKLFLVNNDCYKSGKTISVRGIMVHSTGANNPYLKRYVGPDDGKLGVNANKNHWNVSGLKVCVHAFIGKLDNGSIATYQTLPWNHRGWHAGGSANDTHIGFEICEDNLNDSVYFNKVYKEAVELCAYLCKEYTLNPLADGVIICHSEGYKRKVATNHSDVMHWFPKHGKTMNDFRRDVNDLLSPKMNTSETLKFKLNDIVNFSGGYHYPSANSGSGRSVKPSRAKVTNLAPNSKHPYHIRAVDINGKNINGVYGWVDSSTLTTIEDSYQVKVTTNVLNIRKGPGTNYPLVGSIRDKGTYTIIETSNNWGYLKSEKGWISLDYTRKI